MIGIVEMNQLVLYPPVSYVASRNFAASLEPSILLPRIYFCWRAQSYRQAVTLLPKRTFPQAQPFFSVDLLP